VKSALKKNKSNWFRTVKAIAWSFIGLRKNEDYQKDIESLSPIHIIIVGLVALFIFVFALMATVYWIVG
jgi:hypothetical protein